MEIKNEYLNLSGAQAWEIVVNYVKANNSFKSVTGIPYSI